MSYRYPFHPFDSDRFHREKDNSTNLLRLFIDCVDTRYKFDLEEWYDGSRMINGVMGALDEDLIETENENDSERIERCITLLQKLLEYDPVMDGHMYEYKKYEHMAGCLTKEEAAELLDFLNNYPFDSDYSDEFGQLESQRQDLIKVLKKVKELNMGLVCSWEGIHTPVKKMTDNEIEELFGNKENAQEDIDMEEELFEKYELPDKSRKISYFILYAITSHDPKSGKPVLLTIDEGGGGIVLYASKVLRHESLKEVIEREIPELTGSTKYSLVVREKYDQARDRFGNLIDRYKLPIIVPYFNPDEVKTKHKVKWAAI